MNFSEEQNEILREIAALGNRRKMLQESIDKLEVMRNETETSLNDLRSKFWQAISDAIAEKSRELEAK